ncbi:MAG: hypothetical protein AAFN70_04050, partial [Planctomycetota bacterium]
AGVLLPAWPGFEKHILVCAFGFGIYVMGITQMARREADTTVDNSGQRRNLVIGLTVAILGIVMIAMMPRYAPAARPWFIDPARIYPLVVGMLGFTIFFRGVRLITAFRAKEIGPLIRISLLTIIPLSAAVALVAGGPTPGIVIILLIMPAFRLASFIKMT